MAEGKVPEDLMRREFDVIDHERLARIEERLAGHINREEEMEQRWCALIRDNQKALRSLAQEFALLRIAQAERSGAEKALLWVGGAMFTAGSVLAGAIAWIWDKLPHNGG